MSASSLLSPYSCASWALSGVVDMPVSVWMVTTLSLFRSLTRHFSTVPPIRMFGIWEMAPNSDTFLWLWPSKISIRATTRNSTYLHANLETFYPLGASNEGFSSLDFLQVQFYVCVESQNRASSPPHGRSTAATLCCKWLRGGRTKKTQTCRETQWNESKHQMQSQLFVANQLNCFQQTLMIWYLYFCWARTGKGICSSPNMGTVSDYSESDFHCVSVCVWHSVEVCWPCVSLGSYYFFGAS